MYKQTFSDGENIYSVYMMHKYVNNNKLDIHDIPLPKFKRLLNWKIWGDPNGEMWSINDVLQNPTKYKRDYTNILKSDLNYPIITVYTPLDTYLIIDGNHRYAKSIITKRKTIKSYVFVNHSLIKKFKLGKQTKSVWNKIKKMKQKDFDELYKKRFD